MRTFRPVGADFFQAGFASERETVKFFGAVARLTHVGSATIDVIQRTDDGCSRETARTRSMVATHTGFDEKQPLQE